MWAAAKISVHSFLGLGSQKANSFCNHDSSNCVINLSPDKTAVLQEAFRILKASCLRVAGNFVTILYVCVCVCAARGRDVFQRHLQQPSHSWGAEKEQSFVGWVMKFITCMQHSYRSHALLHVHVLIYGSCTSCNSHLTYMVTSSLFITMTSFLMCLALCTPITTHAIFRRMHVRCLAVAGVDADCNWNRLCSARTGEISCVWVR